MPFIDLHCDTIARLLACQRAGHPCPPAEGGTPPRQPGKAPPQRLPAPGLRPLREPPRHPLPPPGTGRPPYAQSMAARPEDPLEEVLTLADLYWTELAQNRDLARPVLTFQDLVEAQQAGQIGCLLTVEGGGVCRGSLPCCAPSTAWGVGSSPLTWNYPNQLGAPNGQGWGASPRPASPSWRRWRPWGCSPTSPTSPTGASGTCATCPMALPGQPLQRPGPVAPPAEPHRRDAPGPGGPGLPGRGQLLRRLPGPRGDQSAGRPAPPPPPHDPRGRA